MTKIAPWQDKFAVSSTIAFDEIYKAFCPRDFVIFYTLEKMLKEVEAYIQKNKPKRKEITPSTYFDPKEAFQYDGTSSIGSFWTDDTADAIRYVNEKNASQEKKKEEPKFNKFSDAFPLGPPNYFHNSKGNIWLIEDMSRKYIKSSIEWLDSNWGENPPEFVRKKREELSHRLHNM